MQIPKVALAALAFAVLAVTVVARSWGPQLDVQTFQLEHRTGYEAAELIAPYVYQDRGEDPGTMSATVDALTVRETRGQPGEDRQSAGRTRPTDLTGPAPLPTH